MHLLVNVPPAIATSWLLNWLKGVSPRMLRRALPDLHAHYWRPKPLWSASHFAGSVGDAPISILRQ